jgi:hypothetical protein
MNPILCASGVAALVCASASAATLPLTGGPSDVASGFVAVSYNASTQVFTASGFTQSLSGFGGNLGNRQFQLTASINNAGQINPAGSFSLTVRGDVGGTNQLLYSSTSLAPTPSFLTGATDRFEFVFVQQAGSLAPAGSEVGTILVGNFGSFPGGVPVFTQSFTNAPGGFGAGNADTFTIVPSPAGIASLLGGLALAARRRRR